MPGRGRVPETLSPELIEAVRHRYVETDQPVRDITAEFEISVGKLNRLIAGEGWPMRQHRPPRQLPPALRLLEEARKLAAATRPSPLPAQAGERPPFGGLCGERSERRSVSFVAPGEGELPTAEDDGESPSPGALRAPPSPRTRGEGNGDTADADPDPAARIERLVVKELAAEEAMRARLGTAPREAADAERSARTLSILTQTLQNLQRLRAADAAQHSFGSPDDYDDMPADLDEFRRALAQRIEAFVASQPDDEDVAGDGPAGAAPAGA